jgi:hypothetical protein
MFSVGNLLRKYKTAQSEEQRIESKEYTGVVQVEVRTVPVECPVGKNDNVSR